MGDINSAKRLRFLNCISPTYPVEFVETVIEYIEKCLGTQCLQIYDPSCKLLTGEHGFSDVFASNEADFGFIPCSKLLELCQQKKDSYFNIVPVGPCFSHSKNPSRFPEVFSEIVVGSDNRKRIKEFHDLKGHRFAYTSMSSFTGAILPMHNIRKLGFDGHFFATSVFTDSDLKSIRNVLDGKVDAAAVDSVCLSSYRLSHPENARELSVVCSWGPLPSPPLVVNSSLPGDLRKTVVEALLRLDSKHLKVASHSQISAEMGQQLSPVGGDGGNHFRMVQYAKRQEQLLQQQDITDSRHPADSRHTNSIAKQQDSSWRGRLARFNCYGFRQPRGSTGGSVEDYLADLQRLHEQSQGLAALDVAYY